MVWKLGRDLCPVALCFLCPLCLVTFSPIVSLFLCTAYQQDKIHIHTDKCITSTKKKRKNHKLPLILVALFQFPHPLSVVEVAWQPFSLSPLFGVDEDTSA